MKTTQEMIEVMQAYLRGKKIEFRYYTGIDEDQEWHLCDGDKEDFPIWNWPDCDYRIKEEPKTKTLYFYEQFDGKVTLTTNKDPDVKPIHYIELTPKQEGE